MDLAYLPTVIASSLHTHSVIANEAKRNEAIPPHSVIARSRSETETDEAIFCANRLPRSLWSLAMTL